MINYHYRIKILIITIYNHYDIKYALLISIFKLLNNICSN